MSIVDGWFQIYSSLLHVRGELVIQLEMVMSWQWLDFVYISPFSSSMPNISVGYSVLQTFIFVAKISN